MRRWIVTVTTAALGVVGLAQPAAAAEPTRQDVSATGSIVSNDICSFPVTVEFTYTATRTDFFDQNGNLTRIAFHIVEQDAFTANGKRLVGFPYTYNMQVFFDPQTGDVVREYATGVVARVPLPAGDFFMTAGRTVITAHPGVTFLIQPDMGAQGNLQAFCAALAP